RPRCLPRRAHHRRRLVRAGAAPELGLAAPPVTVAVETVRIGSGDADRLLRRRDVAAVEVRHARQARRVTGLATGATLIATGRRSAEPTGVAMEAVAVIVAIARELAVLARSQALLAPAEVGMDVAGRAGRGRGRRKNRRGGSAGSPRRCGGANG